jgi:hypothetical protein
MPPLTRVFVQSSLEVRDNPMGKPLLTDTYHVSATGVLGLRTNAPSVKWSWGVNIPAATAKEYDDCAVRVRLKVSDDGIADPESESAADFGKYHYFGGQPHQQSIYYKRTFLGKRNLEMRMSGLNSDEPMLHVNKTYFRYFAYRFMNLHSPGYILTDMVALLLLRHGFTPLHCSAFRYGDATVLVLAAPNQGKTLTSMMACMEHGSSFLAEDLAITDGKTLYSVPWTSTFRYYDRIDTSRRSQALTRLTKIVPPLELLPFGQTDAVDTFIDSRRMLADSPITHVAILERGHECITDETGDEAYRKAVNLNRYEFNYVKAPALVAYEFFNPDIDLDGAAAEERRLLRQTIDHAQQRLVVRSQDATRYASLLVDHLTQAGGGSGHGESDHAFDRE